MDPRRALARRSRGPGLGSAIACARRDPGAGDAKAIRDYVVSRARPERRDAIATALDGRPPPAPDGGAPTPDGGAVTPAGGPDGGGQ